MSHKNFDCVQAFLLKIECVLTDGRSIPNDSGRSAFMLNEKDTFALRMAKLNGYSVGLYSDEFIKEEAVFFKRYGIEESDIIIPCADRIKTINSFASQHNLESKCILFAGSDIPDTTCAKIAGVVASPCDAAPEMKEVSDYVSTYGGGHLFVREILETVMKTQKRWCFDPVLYAKMF